MRAARAFFYRAFGCWLTLLALYIWGNYLTAAWETSRDALAYPLLAAVGLLAAAVWQRYEPQLDSERLKQLIRLPLRFFLAYIAAEYGFAKLIGEQFYTPLATLDTPLGWVSGFRLTWRFFGYSPLYNNFIGGSQVLGSLLLLSRRTVTLGATLLAIVFANIVLINFAYDIPVKLYSATFLVMIVYLLGEDLTRLRAVFLTNEPTIPRRYTELLKGRRQRIVGHTLKSVVISLLYVSIIQNCLYFRSQKTQTGPVYGAWRIAVVGMGGSLGERQAPWRKVYFDIVSQGAFRNEPGKLIPFQYSVSQEKQTLLLTFTNPNRPPLELQYKRLDPNTLLVRGKSEDKPFTLRLTRFEVEARPR